MANLYFRFATMKSGKSTELLQINHNYNIVDLHGMLLIPEADSRSNGFITSRLGISEQAIEFSEDDNLFDIVRDYAKSNDITYVIVDEANLITRKQAEELSDVVDFLNLDVLAYGLRTNFKLEGFGGALHLFSLADKVETISVKSLCHCGEKATVNARIVNNTLVTDGPEILIDGEDDNVQYIPLCRKCFKLGLLEKDPNIKRSKDNYLNSRCYKDLIEFCENNKLTLLSSDYNNAIVMNTVNQKLMIWAEDWMK